MVCLTRSNPALTFHARSPQRSGPAWRMVFIEKLLYMVPSLAEHPLAGLIHWYYTNRSRDSMFPSSSHYVPSTFFIFISFPLQIWASMNWCFCMCLNARAKCQLAHWWHAACLSRVSWTLLKPFWLWKRDETKAIHLQALQKTTHNPLHVVLVLLQNVSKKKNLPNVIHRLTCLL